LREQLILTEHLDEVEDVQFFFKHCFASVEEQVRLIDTSLKSFFAPDTQAFQNVLQQVNE
jgi:hypothetical protein